MALYPLHLQPEFFERVWGQRSLAPVYTREFAKPVGEVWVAGDSCKVTNGPLAGQTLAELSAKFGRELVGDASTQPGRFPLLIKFLFTREKLSVQVHPDDQHAKASGQQCGKTECWYVLAAEPGARVALGLRPGVTREQLKLAIDKNLAEELLNWVPIRAGEMIYVDAGTVHTIGPGAVLVETQQNSDTTYRLYDYGRPRELHVEHGLAASKEKTHSGKVKKPATSSSADAALVTSPYFVVRRYELRIGKEQLLTRHMPPTSVRVVVALKGRGLVRALGQEAAFAQGEAVVIPASAEKFSIRPQQDLEYLEMDLPQEPTPHPQTTLE